MKLKDLKEGWSTLSKEEKKEAITELVISTGALVIMIIGAYIVVHHYGWTLLFGIVLLQWSNNITQDQAVRARFKKVGEILKMLIK